MKTIALFGGSFDPPHLGHKAVVDAVLSTLDVDKVIVMPAFLNPFKREVYAPSELRLKWLKKIFSSYKNVEVDDFELTCKQKVPSLTTVHHLQKKYDKIYLVIGADNLVTLHKWFGYDELKTLVTFVVATRDNEQIPREYISLHVNEPISSTSLRQEIKKEFLPASVAGEIEKYYKEKNWKKD
jgi:nicotinate-nucleotide adenylyltransferase